MPNLLPVIFENPVHTNYGPFEVYVPEMVVSIL